MLSRYLKSIWSHRFVPGSFYRMPLKTRSYMDFSAAEQDMFIRCFSGAGFSHYKRCSGPVCDVGSLTLAGIRIGDTQKSIRMLLGQPFARRIIQQKNGINTQLLYKNYPVEAYYPCTVFLNLDKDRLTYAAFDFPGERCADSHLDPGFLALFDTADLFLMLKAEKMITANRTLEMNYGNSHLIIDHHDCLKIRMLQRAPYSTVTIRQLYPGQET